jgi:hypothetical protein
MAHLVMDTMIGHELDLMIPESEIARRWEEWQSRVVATRSRSEYVKGLAAFAGLELIEYDSAVVERSIKLKRFDVRVRSRSWASRQPT